MKNIHESFSSLDSLSYLISKIGFLFHTQQYLVTALEAAQRRSSMIGILGREGMGKSSAIAKYLHEHQNVYYVRIGQSYRVSNFLDEMIFQVSGVYPTTQDSLFLKTKILSQQLTKDTSKKLVIVDDAGKLSPRGLGFFHELRDNTIYCTGFVFVGLPYFQKHLLKAKAKGVTGVAEFYRRAESWYTVPGLKQNEISAYGYEHKLNDDQVLQLKNSNIETLSELENLTKKILEANEELNREKDSLQNGKPAKRKKALTEEDG
jgi:DNA transposition AAA+ family ATPase